MVDFITVVFSCLYIKITTTAISLRSVISKASIMSVSLHGTILSYDSRIWYVSTLFACLRDLVLFDMMMSRRHDDVLCLL